MKIAVIGAPGYIGSHLSSQLVNLNHCVHGYDLNLSQNDLSFVDKLISYDIRQELKVSTLYDCVVLLAAKTKVQHSVTNPFSYYETNILGTKNVLNSFTTNHIIFASSGSVYGIKKEKNEIKRKSVKKKFCKTNNVGDHGNSFRYFAT